jgi:hypothetical protein
MRDWLKFDLTGTYNKGTGKSKIKCKGNNAFSQGAKIKLRDLVASAGKIMSGRIDGRAFGRNIETHVP